MTIRKCPNCGVQESRWTVDGKPFVNLDPITGNCVTCLAAFAKETGPAPAALPFDARAAAANDRSEP